MRLCYVITLSKCFEICGSPLAGGLLCLHHSDHQASPLETVNHFYKLVVQFIQSFEKFCFSHCILSDATRGTIMDIHVKRQFSLPGWLLSWREQQIENLAEMVKFDSGSIAQIMSVTLSPPRVLRFVTAEIMQGRVLSNQATFFVQQAFTSAFGYLCWECFWPSEEMFSFSKYIRYAWFIWAHFWLFVSVRKWIGKKKSKTNLSHQSKVFSEVWRFYVFF